MTTPLRRSPRLAQKAAALAQKAELIQMEKDLAVSGKIQLLLDALDYAPTLKDKTYICTILFQYLSTQVDFLRRHQSFRIRTHLLCQMLLKKTGTTPQFRQACTRAMRVLECLY